MQALAVYRHELSHPPCTPDAVSPSQRQPGSPFPSALSSPEACVRSPGLLHASSSGRASEQGLQHSSERHHAAGLNPTEPRSPYAGELCLHGYILNLQVEMLLPNSRQLRAS